jgi:protein N-lysine methyltransferase METTL21A
VELGAGGGLVGLAVARGCETDLPIYITDQEPMLPLMQSNIAINNLSSKVKPALLDWAFPPSADIPEHPAVVLAADCIYFEPAFPLLISTLQRLLGPQTICYFCFKRRRRADLRCIKMIKKLFSCEEICSFSNCEEYNRENLFLYKIQSRQKS